MNVKFKKSISIIISIAIILLMSNSINAAVQVPATIRIGLNYASTSLSSFTVNAEKGIQLGCYISSKFNILYDEPTNADITVRKDTYYVLNNGKLKEFKPTDKVIPSGDRSGPFHTQIGGDYADFQSANSMMKKIRLAGIKAYLAYTGIWQIWTGFYSNQVTAQSDIDNNIKSSIEGNIDTTNLIYTIKDCSNLTNQIVAQKDNGEVVLLFTNTSTAFRIRARSENNPDVLKLNDSSKYRGDIEVRRLTGSDMTIINVISFEQYLYGVVPCEIGASSYIEALKAQAVAARTYALTSMNKHSKYFFNLCSTTDCQVYGGYGRENASTNKSVNDTKGKILTYNGKPASTFFFSSDGGRTEDCSNVWNLDIPYLKSVEDKYESGDTWNYNWQQTFTSDKIKSTLLGKNYDLGTILRVEVTKLSASGRAIEMVIEGTKGIRTFKNESCRTILNLPSQLFKITTDSDISVRITSKNNDIIQLGSQKVATAKGIETLTASKKNIVILSGDGDKTNIPSVPNNYTITGKGWGHAVGMSQDGAIGMAKHGFTYIQILTHYYTGTVVE